MIVSCIKGNNDLAIASAMELYAAPGMRIADVTYGLGNFWKLITLGNYDFYPSDIKTGIDFRDLPYSEAFMDIVVLDPPYLYKTTGQLKEDMGNAYGVNDSLPDNKSVLNLYYNALPEAYRVLHPGGLLWIKCQDIQQSNVQYWNHITIFNYAVLEFGFKPIDLFVVAPKGGTPNKYSHQLTARKNHSYLWIFQMPGKPRVDREIARKEKPAYRQASLIPDH